MDTNDNCRSGNERFILGHAESSHRAKASP